MSSTTAIAKLHSPLKELVEGATKEGSAEFGKSEKDKAEVTEWIERVAAGEAAKPENLKGLDEKLTPRTYIVNEYLTVADVALYAALHPVLSQLQSTQYYSYPAITRYFDHIQSRPSVRKSAETLAPAFSLVQFDLENAPRIERKADPPKEKKKAAKGNATPADRSGTATPVEAPVAEKNKVAESSKPATADAENAGAKAQKKEKKEKKEKKATAESGSSKKAAAPKAARKMLEIRCHLWSIFALDISLTVSISFSLYPLLSHRCTVEKHPDADGLYVEQIDFGEETGPRTVVSGLVHYIPIEQMRDKYLVGVCNLKPASMRGIKSFAMVLCATSKDGKEAGIELIQPPLDSKPGDRVFFEGPDFESATPLAQMNPKKKIFETVQPGFITLESKEAAWVNPETKSVHRIRTARGVCVAPTLIGASLS
ncbi:hypothetical protein EW026_g1163 [Hermanssonia centrifuga]|uniref:Nucleic acid-binding protein n=1 Tax=Hermanssonia centrifuga TaxID=98765 RepID=A0A4S4KU74_9APHY|nr:hypothetical protein EW026_g1163 [Hermanssonia centrifuga]